MTDHDAMTDDNIDHDIEDRLRGYYGPQQLSAGRLAELREMVQSGSDVEHASPMPLSPRRNRWIAMAGVVALVLAVIALRSLPDRDERPTAEITTEITTEIVAEEIATNHFRDMPVEVETDFFDSALRSLPDIDKRLTAKDKRLIAKAEKEVETDAFDFLAEGLDKLDFRPVSSTRLDERGLQLVGGRYCKIQGQIAAQIKLRDAAGRTWTLYECRDSELLSGVRARRVKTMGLEVEIWREAGVLFGLAGPPD